MKSNPRILLVAGSFPLASETFVREQGLQLVGRGVDLEILAVRPGAGATLFCAGWVLRALDRGQAPGENGWEAADPDQGGFAGNTEMRN
ncbi:MAG: hypothetical protein GY825_10600, partial [Phycisphaeraceae bacterium]|nr:hypothetical protein [Phycisphaeraceae bacterium]